MTETVMAGTETVPESAHIRSFLFSLIVVFRRFLFNPLVVFQSFPLDFSIFRNCCGKR
jgi:hypothetical protein